MTICRKILMLFALLLTPVVGSVYSCHAQGANDTYVLPPGAAPAMDPHDIADKIARMSPKTVVFVFDVTQSTRTGGVFEREREATATILSHGCKAGDHVALIKFGTGISTVFDAILSDSVSTDSLIDKIPPSVEPGAGTNIRWPHHEALRMIDADSPNPGVVVLLTDSFNDQPIKTDPNYEMYRAYYNLYKLTVYPKTPENRDYERLLRKLYREHRLHEYGVGVAIARGGRPVERLPNAPGESDSSNLPDDIMPTVITPQGHEKTGPDWVTVIGIPLLVSALVGFAFFFAASQTAHIRIAVLGKPSATDFRLKTGGKVSLGGSPSTAAPGVQTFSIPGLKEPAAYIVGQFGRQAVLKPAANSAVKVLHNGLKLDSDMPIRIDDEVRIVMPATDGADENIVRLRFRDPNGPL